MPPDGLATARADLHRCALRMVSDRLVIGSAGNVSSRLDRHHAVVTARGVPYERLGPGDHPVVDLRDGSWTGRLAPTSELALHLELLRALPDVDAVVHTHSRYATAFSVARRDLPFIINENLGPASQHILVADYAVPGSSALGDSVIATLDRQPGSRACLLANHGTVAIGATLDAAYLVATQVEWIAEISYLASTLGAQHVLGPEVQDAMARNYGVTIARPIG